MLKRALLTLLVALHLMAVAGIATAHAPLPECFPCPDVSSR